VLVTGEVARLFYMAITITAAAVIMFASLTLVPMLAGLLLNPEAADVARR